MNVTVQELVAQIGEQAVEIRSLRRQIAAYEAKLKEQAAQAVKAANPTPIRPAEEPRP